MAEYLGVFGYEKCCPNAFRVAPKCRLFVGTRRLVVKIGRKSLRDNNDRGPTGIGSSSVASYLWPGSPEQLLRISPDAIWTPSFCAGRGSRLGKTDRSIPKAPIAKW